MISITINAQISKRTLEATQKLVAEQKYSEAVLRFEPYALKNLKNFDVQLYYAQLLMLNGNSHRARLKYRELVNNNPEKYDLKYEYAHFLVEKGHVEEAIPLLESYLSQNPDYEAAKNDLAKAYYWNGEVEKAQAYSQKLLSENLQNSEAQNIINEIDNLHTYHASLQFSYSKDNQITERFGPKLVAYKYYNSLLTPYIVAKNDWISGNSKKYHDTQILLGNHFSFPSSNLKVEAAVGFADVGKKDVIGKIRLKKDFLKFIFTEGSIERKPYNFTLSALENTIFTNEAFGAVGLQTKKEVVLKALYQLNNFGNEGNVSSVAAYILSPPLRLGKYFEISVGYSFGYTNSERSNFVSSVSLQDVIANSLTEIPGIYDGYFTPKNQLNNTSVISLTYKNGKFNWQNSAVLNLSSSADQPVLSVNYQSATPYFETQFYKQNYSPLNLKSTVNYKFSSKMEASLTYEVLKTFFYNAHTGSIYFGYVF